MITLEDILQRAAVVTTSGSLTIGINQICFDSRKVSTGDLFVAVRGTQVDGHNYIATAIAQGAAAILCEELPSDLPDVRPTFVIVEDSALSLGIVASNFYGNPSSQLKLIGVTGTNGKTTIATLLHGLFQKLGYRSGLFSTIKILVGDTETPSTHTTPDPLTLNAHLRQMVDQGCSYCFMEVSSHSVVQQRIACLEFAGGVFTNITHDHLDFHKTFKEYIAAKKAFFDGLPQSAFALTNNDDKNGNVMLQNTRALKCSYALRSFSDFKCKVLENHFDGMLLNVDGMEMWTRFIGNFNAYNLLAVYATALQLDQQREEVLTILSELTPVDGRFETIRSNDSKTAIVDYAHTPDALDNVLKAINDIRQSGQKIITVVGAGGNRDKTKRPEMAKIAAQLSDKVILTSDNPRFEDPLEILKDMEAGLTAESRKETITIADRREAIRTACFLAQENDIVLVAGKGHETYQDVQGVKHHFDDREVVREQFGL